MNSSILPDSYPLGATKVVGENKLQFTSALDAFKESATFMSQETSFEIKNYNSKKSLNVNAGSAENSANVEQYGYGKWESQKWYFEKVEDGYFKIVNKNSGKVLEMGDMSTDVGAPCKQYEYNGGWNQQWKIVETSDKKYKLQNRLSNLYLGISSASIDDGAWCVQMADSDSDNLKWCFLVTE